MNCIQTGIGEFPVQMAFPGGVLLFLCCWGSACIFHPGSLNGSVGQRACVCPILPQLKHNPVPVERVDDIPDRRETADVETPAVDSLDEQPVTSHTPFSEPGQTSGPTTVACSALQHPVPSIGNDPSWRTSPRNSRPRPQRRSAQPVSVRCRSD